MKLNTNILSPAAALFTESGLLRHLSSVRRSLSIAYRGVLAQRQLLDRAMRQGDDVSIEELAKAIDAVVEQTVVADSVPILDGRCARGSYSLSLWFMAVDRPPRYYHEDLRHRMYVPTMTARTLSLRPPPRPEHNSQLLAQSRQAIRKAAADLRAYLQRLRLVERRVRRQAEQAISHVNRRSPALTEQQLRDHYMDDLQHLEDVLLHLRVVVHRARRPQLSAFDRQLLQVEVSQWVDELERTTKESSFNGHALLGADFGRDSRVASMWFVAGGTRRRVYLPDLSPAASGLKTTHGAIVTVSSPEFHADIQAKVRTALNKVRRARRRLKNEPPRH